MNGRVGGLVYRCVWPQVWSDKEIREFLAGEEKRGRKIHLLSPVYDGEEFGEDSGTPTKMASLCEVQDNSGTVSETARGSKWEVCDMQERGRGEGTLQEREVEIPCGGPLSPDRASSGAFMLKLQHAFGAGGGELRIASCNEVLPHGPHIFKNEVIGGAKWDWFQMGGRWTGFYKLKEAVAQIGGVLGTPGLMTPEAEAGHADQLIAGDVDFEGMRTQAAVKAFQQYEDVAHAFGGEIPKIERLWKEVVEDQTIGDIQARRDFYHAQPALVRLKELQDAKAMPESVDRFFFDLEEFQCDEEAYVERAKNSACVPFAFVKEGQWYERGRMGWWACVSNEKDRDEWNRQFNKMMDELPANTLLTLVDCHI